MSLSVTLALAAQLLSVDASTLDRIDSCDRLTVDDCAPLAELVDAGSAGVDVALQALGAEEPAARTRARRFLALPALGAPEKRAAKVRAALDKLPDDRRGEALVLLGELGHPDAGKLLAAVIADEAADPRNRIYAAAGLAEIAGETSRQALEGALYVPIPRLQETAAASLGRRHLPEAIPALINVATAELIPGFVRVAAVRALAASKDPSVVPALVLVLGVPQLQPQTAAMEALAALGARVAVPAILPALRVPETMPVAVRALGAMRDPRAVPALVDLLSAADVGPDVVSAVLWALGDIGDATAVPALTARLSEKDLGVARAAAEALGRIGSPTATEALATVDAQGDAAFEKALAWARERCAAPAN